MTLYAKILSCIEQHDFPSIPRKNAAQWRHLYLHGRTVLKQWYFPWSVAGFIVCSWYSSCSLIFIFKKPRIFPARSSALLYIYCAAASVLQLSSQSQQVPQENVILKIERLYVHQSIPIIFISCHCSGHVRGQTWHRKNERKCQRSFYACKYLNCNLDTGKCAS